MRRITIITGLLAAAALPVASAQAGRPLAKADAERVAVRHLQVSVAAAEAYGAYDVKSTSQRCQRASASRIACNFALWLRAVMPGLTDHVCLSSVTILRSSAGRIVREATTPACD